MHEIPVRVGEDLDFDVAWRRQKPLQQQRAIPEGAFSKAPRPSERVGDLAFLLHDAHAFTATAGRRLNDQGQSQLESSTREVFEVLPRAVVPGKHRDARGAHSRLCHDLRAHGSDRRGRWTHEHEARVYARLGELRFLGKETVAGMNGLSTRGAGGLENALDVEIAFARRRRADSIGLVGLADVLGASVRVGEYGNGAHAEPPRRTENTAGDLAAVCHQQALDHASRLPSRGRRPLTTDPVTPPMQRTRPTYIRNIPKRVSCSGAFRTAARLRLRMRRVSIGSMTPSSQSRADA